MSRESSVVEELTMFEMDLADWAEFFLSVWCRCKGIYKCMVFGLKEVEVRVPKGNKYAAQLYEPRLFG